LVDETFVTGAAFAPEHAHSHSHVVNFYDDESQVTADIARFAADGLANGERVILVATAAHRAAVDEVLVQFGADAARARFAGRLVTLDAGEALATFMVEGAPDPRKFDAYFGSLVDLAAEDGCAVRVFGEMVALLWEQGNVPGAIEVEGLWNALGRSRPFSLLCAYPSHALETGALADANQVCELHSDVLPPRSYARAVRHDDPGHLAERTSQVFVPLTAAVPAARRFVAEVLRSWGEDALLTDASVIVSELTTNAVLHAASAFRVHLTRRGSTVRISVDDVGPARPQPRQAAPEDFGGRGMKLIEAFTREWGCDVLDSGKSVWADLSAQRAGSDRTP
jgi:anti-sigma regulatory factor (Ser/Thr protein kinase)